MTSDDRSFSTDEETAHHAESVALARPSSRRTTNSSKATESEIEKVVEEEEEDPDRPFSPEQREDETDKLPNEKDVETATAAPVSEKNTRISVNDLSKIPNGGLRAWLQVLGSFFLFCNTWGVTNTYGVFQTYYELDLLRDSNPSAISWVGSIQAFLLMLVGALTGPAYDAGYFRELLWGGSFLLVLGHMMLSLCTKYWQVLLAQAFCVGGGMGMLFVPGVAIISTYFSSRVAVATGLAATGSSLGGVIYPIIINRLTPQIGFPWTVRVIAFINLATLSVPLLAMKVRVLPDQKRPLVDWSAFKQLEFVLFNLGMLIGFLGLYSLFFFVQSYAIAKNIMDRDLAFYLLSMLNATSALGRTLPSILADIIGPLNCLIPAAAISGVLIICLIAVGSSAALIVVVLFFGFFSGTFVSLPPTVILYMTKNRGLLGTRLGMCFATVGLGMLIGPPIEGAVLDAAGFTAVWIFGGVVTLGGVALLTMSRLAFKGLTLRAKC